MGSAHPPTDCRHTIVPGDEQLSLGRSDSDVVLVIDGEGITAEPGAKSAEDESQGTYRNVKCRGTSEPGGCIS
jgi:hypothetical protein